MVAVRDSSGDLDQVNDLMQDHGHELTVINGLDSTAHAVLKLGGKLMILGSANVMPRQWVELFGSCATAETRRRDRVRELQDLLGRAGALAQPTRG